MTASSVPPRRSADDVPRASPGSPARRTSDTDAAWAHFPRGPWSAADRLPHATPSKAGRAHLELPRSLVVVPGAGVAQSPVFDPALTHYARAMRAGEPRFEDAGTAARWHRARRQAMDHVLEAVAGSRWVDDLVLRGSVLLKAWYGSAAREPGDLDFVVTPSGWGALDGRTDRMFADIARRAERVSDTGGEPDVRVVATLALSDEIWTYDRVPGRRLVLPWRADGVPSGTVQLDFVFGEQLPSAPEPTEIPRSDGGGTHLLLGATPEQSLAWKLLWLIDDIHPQGKDLYDAVLLAENTSPGMPLLRATFVASDPSHGGHPFTADLFSREVDLREFRKEYPESAGTDLHTRLLRALAPTFAVARVEADRRSIG
ncbi:nucleotidyl transferase AbiEii/AbiGii toxin family protein [Embleya sp. NPDC050154]|uniref:nucleotidyl transferase AbiEii/AbiGii toxin family protein n=1 Tax=Embleya sp. NPDC050154 TaxID=3363988 RepID=UPI0037AD1403